MTDRLRRWDQIAGAGWPTLLIGNGLSINIWSHFSYNRLVERADLNSAARQLFKEFGTVNFEIVLEALWHAERTLTALGRGAVSVQALYRHVQEELLNAVRRVHVPWDALPTQVLTRVATGLRAHQTVFTLNYDLISYWAVMAAEESAGFGDYFWSSQNTFNIADCELASARTGLVYLHGGVHLWQDSVTGSTGKWTRRSGGRLLKRFERDFEELPNRRPLVVSEGTSAQKMAVIRRSDYLSFGLRRLVEDSTNTVIFGASFGAQDAHVVDALNAGRPRRFAISILPGTDAHNVATMARYRERLPGHQLNFFDSTSHPLGNRSLSVSG